MESYGDSSDWGVFLDGSTFETNIQAALFCFVLCMPHVLKLLSLQFSLGCFLLFLSAVFNMVLQNEYEIPVVIFLLAPRNCNCFPETSLITLLGG